MKTSGYKIKDAGIFIFLVLLLPSIIIGFMALCNINNILTVLKTLDPTIDTSNISKYAFLIVAGVVINIIFAIIVLRLVLVLSNLYDTVDLMSKNNNFTPTQSNKPTVTNDCSTCINIEQKNNEQ